MTPAEIEAAFHAMCECARHETLPHFRAAPEVENKLDGAFDPVTLADRGAERAIRAWLADHRPDDGIIGEEEENHQADAEYCWIIDPVDGTRAFISGLPVWGTLIGLYHNGQPLAGMMHQPFTGEKFLTTGKGSFLDHAGKRTRLATSPLTSLGDVTAMTTSPDILSASEKPAWERIRQQVKLVRYGCDCYAYCMLAAGHVELVIESGLKVYDIAALIPIIEQAGGCVATWDDGSPSRGGQIIAAANRELLVQAQALLTP